MRSCFFLVEKISKGVDWELWLWARFWRMRRQRDGERRMKCKNAPGPRSELHKLATRHTHCLGIRWVWLVKIHLPSPWPLQLDWRKQMERKPWFYPMVICSSLPSYLPLQDGKRWRRRLGKRTGGGGCGWKELQCSTGGSSPYFSSFFSFFSVPSFSKAWRSPS